ncbi:hypothetical protein [Natrinema sp. CGMCC1.2065]
MAVTVATSAGEQFVDATTDDGEMVLIEEVDSDGFGRCGWTVLEFKGAI